MMVPEEIVGLVEAKVSGASAVQQADRRMLELEHVVRAQLKQTRAKKPRSFSTHLAFA
jgi:hypothetical protein